MTSVWQLLWTGLMVAAMIWYSTITIYVAIKGALDIKGMLQRLKETGPAD